MNYCVLYNPFAGTVNDVAFQTELKTALPEDKLEFYDLTKIDFAEFFAKLNRKTGVIIAGGDGTLNRFVNATADLKIANPVTTMRRAAATTSGTIWARSRATSPCS